MGRNFYVMKLKLIICFILFTSGASNVSGQSIIYSGEIYSETGPLPYVNIGIQKKNIGSISDKNGMFKISIPTSNIKDTLYFSYLGFETHKIIISRENRIDLKIKLEPIVEKLDEVVLFPIDKSSTKKVSIGTKSSSRMVAGYVRNNAKDNYDIQEFAKLIKIKKNKVLTLENLNIKLFNVQNIPTTFRINFYDLKDGVPHERIIDQEILFTQKLINGWNKFDLRSWDLFFEDSFFVTIEYIPNMEVDKKSPFKYSGMLFGKSIKRTSSLGSWNIKKGATISMYIEAQESNNGKI